MLKFKLVATDRPMPRATSGPHDCSFCRFRSIQSEAGLSMHCRKCSLRPTSSRALLMHWERVRTEAQREAVEREASRTRDRALAAAQCARMQSQPGFMTLLLGQLKKAQRPKHQRVRHRAGLVRRALLWQHQQKLRAVGGTHSCPVTLTITAKPCTRGLPQKRSHQRAGVLNSSNSKTAMWKQHQQLGNALDAQKIMLLSVRLSDSRLV